MNSVARARHKPRHVPARVLRLKEPLAGLLRGTRDLGYLLQTAAVFSTLIPIAFARFYAYRSAERETTEAVLGKNGRNAFRPQYAPRGDSVNLSQAPAVRRALQGRRGVTAEFSQTENAGRIPGERS